MDEHLTLREHRQGDEIFQHDVGVWNISAIREGINTEPSTFKTIEIPLDRKFIDYCRRNIGVSVKRARELTIAQREDPGIIITRSVERRTPRLYDRRTSQSRASMARWPASNESLHSRRARRTLAHQRHDSDRAHRDIQRKNL